MNNFKLYFDSFCAFIGATLGWFFGGADGLLLALLAFTFMDYFTGVIAASVHHELSSSVGFSGIARKVYIFVLVGTAHIIDEQLISQIAFLKDTAVLRDAVILFYCANEGLSILENADKLNLPIPQQVKKLLLNIQNKAEKKDYNNNSPNS